MAAAGKARSRALEAGVGVAAHWGVSLEPDGTGGFR